MSLPVLSSAALVFAGGNTTTSTSIPCQIPPGGAYVQGLCTENGSLHISIAYVSVFPVLVMSIGALLLLGLSAVLSRRSRPALYCFVTLGIAAVSLVASIVQWYDVGTSPQATIGGQIFYDRFSVLFMMLISIAVGLAAITSQHYLKRENLDGVEAYVLLAMSAVGAMLMAASGSLITLFLGLEIMSIALYVLAAYHRNRVESGEAGFKYFILGSFSSAIFLYGIALMYGATGSVNYSNIALFLSQNTLQHSGVLLAGMGLLIVGLGFKVAAVPFHFWTPDVYQGTPTPFTGYMAAVAKAAGFAGLLRILNQALPSQEVNWRPIIWILTVLTVFLGSLMALSQKDLKRAFAYSSVSQAGFVLVGVEANSATGTAGALFYLFTYTFIIIGTFAIVGLIQGKGEARDDLGAVRGLSRRDPLLAGAFLILLLAQAGVPLTSGFLAKFYVIDAVEGRGQYWLAIIAMLSAAIVAFFYLRIAILMYSAPKEPEAAAVVAPTPVLAGAGTEGGVLGEESMAEDGSDGLTARLETEAVVADPSLAGLEPIESLDGERGAVAVLEAPTTGRIPIPAGVGVVIAICVIFTIAAGVSGFMIDFARAATF